MQGRERGSRVVVVGVASHWGAELARALERESWVDELIGVDTEPPRAELGRTELVEADIRGPEIARLLPPLEPDLLVHCGIVWYPQPGKPPSSLHDFNVIGTLQLLSACEQIPSLRAVIARGSAAIYGSNAAAPSFFSEEMAGRYPLKTRFQRDVDELERYFGDFARRRPEVTCTMLRFQPEIGPGLDQPLARYLSLPVVPTQLGFDPRLQLLHADDATGALVAAARNPVPGAVNVAPDGAISLSRVLRLAGRPAWPVPHLAAPLLAQLGRTLGAADLSNDGLRLLRYGRGCDNARLKRDVGYEPRYDAEAAARDFAAVAGARHRLFPQPA